MGLFKKFDFKEGKLPPWLEPFVALTRPMGVNGMVAIPVLGASSVGIVSLFSAERGAYMAKNSAAFLQGIPEPAWYAIVAIALGYTGAKSWEVIKAPPPPTGRKSPESEAEEDAAPTSRIG